MMLNGLAANILLYLAAAFFELVGSYAVWAVVRLGKSPLWLLGGVGALLVFTYLLTRIDTDAAGRTYAAYGGIYILASLVWLWKVDGMRPDVFDVVGVGLSVAGAMVILLGRLGAG